MTARLLDRPVGQLVAEQPARSRVFERWGIDYCCGGKKALSEACAAKSIDSAKVVHDLELSDSIDTQPETDWTKRPLAELCDHIVSVHHGYMREALPRLSMLTTKVAARHGARDVRLAELSLVFEAFRSEMESHMLKEETCLFPALRTLDAGSPDQAIDETIQAMLAEHDSAGADLAKMRALTQDFTPNSETCNTQRAMLHGLAEMEADMHQHVHKENNILFPRALDIVARASS